MRTIRVKTEQIRYPEDCKKIQDALFDKGLYSPLEHCQQLCELYSEDHYAAGWLIMKGYNKNDIYNAIKEYFEEGPDSGTDTRYL